jgi:hypothetical protein
MQQVDISSKSALLAPRFAMRENVAHESQSAWIRRYLEAGRPLTAIVALRECGCFRLAARIYDLQSTGLVISVRTITVGGKRVAEYSMGGVAA